MPVARHCKKTTIERYGAGPPLFDRLERRRDAALLLPSLRFAGDRYVIYDDGSTDRTLELLGAHDRVENAAIRA